MTKNRHPAPENLMSCAAGSMPEALAAVMACHMDMCKHCQDELTFLTLVGATLMEDIPPSNLQPDRTLPAIERFQYRATELKDRASDVPSPLQKFIGHQLKDVRWQRVVPGIWQFPIPLSGHSDANLRLIKVAPGFELPDHEHSGAEATLVLQGAFRDKSGVYGVGDVIEMDESLSHAPIAENEGCICLYASEGRMRFRGFLARIVQKLTGF